MNTNETRSKKVEIGSEKDAPYEIDFCYLESILHVDQEGMKDFLKHAKNDLEVLKNQFLVSTEERDKKKFDEGLHKAKWIFKMFGVNETKHFRECKEMLEQRAISDFEWKRMHEKCIKMFEHLLFSIDKHVFS